MRHLSDRKRRIVDVIVGDYIKEVAPIASDVIARDSRLDVSAATIRNEVAELEEDGYLTRPHPSAGSVPLPKSYRLYVATVESSESHRFPDAVRSFVWQQLWAAEWGLDEWSRASAALLADLVGNMAIATFPKERESRVRHIELVPLQDVLALLVIVLGQARLRRQLVRLAEPMDRSVLESSARRLQELVAGHSWREIDGLDLDLSRLEEEVLATTVGMLKEEDRRHHLGHSVDGLRNLLDQPEFHDKDSVRPVLEALEDGSLAAAVLDEAPDHGAVNVVIDGENRGDMMVPLSVVIGQYGIPGEAAGTIGAVGPVRMEYSRAIASVQLMVDMMSQMVEVVHGVQ